MLSEKISARAKKINQFHVMRVMSRAKALEQEGQDIIHMEVGEPDFSTPKPVIEAAKDFLDKGNVHYTEAKGLLALRQKISQFYKKQYGVLIDEEQIFITPGASGALSLALATVLDKEAEVLIADPGYPCNENLISLLGGKAKKLAVDAVNGYQLSGQLIGREWGEATTGVMLASPSNPTGTMVSAEQMQEIIDSTEQKNGFLISDEIYHGLVYGKQANSALNFTDNAYVINSFSKYFGMTGWRLGWLVVPQAAIGTATKLIQNLFIAAPTHSQYAALAAFEEQTLGILEQRREAFRLRRDTLYEGLKKLGFIIPVKPEGAFYIYADCTNFSNDSFQFSLDLLEQAGVAVTPGIDFGLNKPEQYCRFAYTTSLQRIEEGLRRIEKFIA